MNWSLQVLPTVQIIRGLLTALGLGVLRTARILRVLPSFDGIPGISYADRFRRGGRETRTPCPHPLTAEADSRLLQPIDHLDSPPE